MFYTLLLSLFIFLFGFFNLFGIKQSLGLTMLLNFIIGIIGYFSVKKIGWKFFRTNAQFFYWLFVFLLILTYVIGLEVKGSKRWIDLLFFRFQASEFFKVFFILFVADFFARVSHSRKDLGSFAQSLFYFIIPAAIVFRQPDLGNAMVYFFIFIVMLFFSHIPKKFLGYLIGAGALFTPAAWFFLKEYQKNRILSFIMPHAETQTNAYNMIQAIITIGSGNMFGRGLGLGTQSRFYFLPENSTDFAFSSLVEQFGFVGGAAVVVLYGILLIILIKRAYKFVYTDNADGYFAFLYIIGLIALIFFQSFVNIGMNMGVLPIAGIALPFISYGGSMLVSLLIGFALIP